MNPHQQEEVTARAEISKTPSGLMSGPAWRAGPFCVVFEAPEKGPEVLSWSDITGMGAQMPEAPRVWQLGLMQAVYLYTGPENGICSPGSACILHLWGTEPNPGPVAMTSMGANHVCGSVTWQGQNRARCSAGHG